MKLNIVYFYPYVFIIYVKTALFVTFADVFVSIRCKKIYNVYYFCTNNFGAVKTGIVIIEK